MKQFIVLFALLTALFATSHSQSTDKYRQIYESSATDTMSSIVTAYSIGDRVGSITANKILLATSIPTWHVLDQSGTIKNVKFTFDSVSTGLFRFYALKDSAGVGAAIASDNAALQLTTAMRDNLIGQGNFSLRTAGSSSSFAYADTAFTHLYRLASGKSKIYWVIEAASAYTPKKSGIVKITVAHEIQ